ncbi:SDR family NAD(P)-dependent oxidoreductase [Rhodoferax saidenbachensis]|uniref:Short-chain dehydrogenase n=1 Tax=Rhodoferax saidenbachensis TaxID=1484693 RepID=A0A1P8KAZ2_9BURK|nr:SDR family NAD(P)-dependent oxidoreductase [Rhodoferax saidenbachensis]APW43173.1 short-chain dehydrogenase [Rhodoferax saidenbachensis]
MPRYELSGRVVVITGATGALGSALARALRAKGARIALLARDMDKAQALAQELGGAEVALACRADVQSYDELEHAMAAVVSHFGRMDVVLANAGIDHVAPMVHMDAPTFERVIDINLNGVWRTFRSSLQHVQAQQGYLMAICSMAAFVHSPLQAHYTASKAGVSALCNSVRLELRDLNVGVGCVYPTFFPSPLLERMQDDDAGKKLWSGNQRGLWETVSLEDVVAGIVHGIERRRSTVVVPKRNALVMLMPGLFRLLIEPIGFKRAAVKAAIALTRPR